MYIHILLSYIHTHTHTQQTPDYAFLESGSEPCAVESQEVKEQQPVYCEINDFRKTTHFNACATCTHN